MASGIVPPFPRCPSFTAVALAKKHMKDVEANGEVYSAQTLASAGHNN
ncbi:hypothetical protein Vi05172_g11922 [Venturia inaequalis]|nr:hypothetical protein Vi05172_g11922 [Venturia inaequalis]